MVLAFGNSFARPMQHLTDAHIGAIDCNQYGYVDEEGRIKRPNPKCMFWTDLIGQGSRLPISFPPLGAYNRIDCDIGTKGDWQNHHPWPFNRKSDYRNDFHKKKKRVEGLIVIKAIRMFIGRAKMVGKPRATIKCIPVEGCEDQYQFVPPAPFEVKQSCIQGDIGRHFLDGRSINYESFFPRCSQWKSSSKKNLLITRVITSQITNILKGVLKIKLQKGAQGKFLSRAVIFNHDICCASKCSATNTGQIRVVHYSEFFSTVKSKIKAICGFGICSASSGNFCGCSGTDAQFKISDSSSNVGVRQKTIHNAELPKGSRRSISKKIMPPKWPQCWSQSAGPSFDYIDKLLVPAASCLTFLRQIGAGFMRYVQNKKLQYKLSRSRVVFTTISLDLREQVRWGFKL